MTSIHKLDYLTRGFRSSKNSKPVQKDSKVVQGGKPNLHYILGISNAELASIRNHSVSSDSTVYVESVCLSDATTAPVSGVQVVQKKKRDTLDLHEIALKASSELLREDYNSDNDSSELRELRAFGSASTLRSYYDPTNEPLSVSQQTSDSSTRDFALRRDTPSLLSSVDKEMEHAKQLRLLFPSRISPKHDTGKLVKHNKHPSMTASDPHRQTHSNSSKQKPVSNTQAAIRPVVSLSNLTSPAVDQYPMDIVTRPTDARNALTSHKVVFEPTPIKVNVRRPELGAKHWFDDLDGDSDESDRSDQLGASTSFADKIDEAFRHIGSRDETHEIQKAYPSPVLASQMQDYPHRSLRIAELEAELPSHIRLSGLVDKPTRRNSVHTKKSSSSGTMNDKAMTIRKRIDPFAAIDLNEHSVLFLSSSDDEDDEWDEEDKVYTHHQSLSGDLVSTDRTRQKVRDSFVTCPDGSVDDAASETGSEIVDRPEARRSTHASTKPCPRPLVFPSRASEESAYVNNISCSQDMSESDIITSFPATPTDPNASRRASWRDRILPDNASTSSTRVMTVTRQEEHLLAAMRIKKAAMRSAQVKRDGKNDLLYREDGGDGSHVQTKSRSHSGSSIQSQDVLEERPVQQHAPQRRFTSSDRRFRCESPTTFQTGSSLRGRSNRTSQATYMTDFSEDLQSPYRTFAAEGPGNRVPLSHSTDGERSTVRDTFFSTGSDGSSYQRDSCVMRLGGVERQRLRDEIPSQLYIQAPFYGWEARAGLTAH